MVSTDGAWFGFVCLGECEDEWDLGFHEPLGKAEVDVLWGELGVNEDEYAAEAFSVEEVVCDEFLEFALHVLGGFGVAVAGEID